MINKTLLSGPWELCDLTNHHLQVTLCPNLIGFHSAHMNLQIHQSLKDPLRRLLEAFFYITPSSWNSVLQFLATLGSLNFSLCLLHSVTPPCPDCAHDPECAFTQKSRVVRGSPVCLRSLKDHSSWDTCCQCLKTVLFCFCPV